MAVTFDSSAGAAMGSTTCQPPSAFLSVVVSPDSDLMRSPSSWSDSTDARTFSSFDTNGLGIINAVHAALPHLLKRIFDQERPDRLTALGHLHGVPLSGKRLDAFPSGHAVHIGALASAATVLPPAQRNAIWAVGGGLVVTRIVLLAHWTSDVVAGLAVGAVIERLLRFVTGFGCR